MAPAAHIKQLQAETQQHMRVLQKRRSGRYTGTAIRRYLSNRATLLVIALYKTQ